MTQPSHTDVGAYSLGLLEAADRAAFEQHLADCDACRAELDEMSALAAALTDLAPDLASSLQDQPRSATAPEDAVVHLRDRQQSRRGEQRGRALRTNPLLTAAAAIVLVVGGALLGTWVADGQGGAGSTPSDSVHRPAGELLLTGERFSATDRGTGTTGVFGVESRGWGTHLAMELRGVRGPLECQLIAVSRTGERQVAMSWKVPNAGYGVPGSPDPLVLHGATSIPRTEVARVEVRTAEGKTLLTVPL